MRAILFDVNGTLLDTREHIFWLFEELTRTFDGVPASRREIADAMHGTLDDVIRTLVKNDEVAFEKIKTHHDELYEQSLDRLQLYPGTAELLPILRRIGFRIGAVTSGDHRVAEALRYTGIHHLFDIVVGDDHVAKPKPHPDGIEYALTHLGVPPEHAIVVGDTASDVVAGKRAGAAKTIAVLHGFGDSTALKDVDPDHLIEDIPSLLDVVE